MLGELVEDKFQVYHVTLWPEIHLLLGEVVIALFVWRSFWHWRSPEHVLVRTVAERSTKGCGDHWVYLRGEGEDLIGFICKTEGVKA